MTAPTHTSTASIDLGLLNVMLAEVVSTAALRVHLQASSTDNQNDTQSVASWSAPVADLVGGQIEHRFHVDPSSKSIAHLGEWTWQLSNLNSDPAYPTLSVVSAAGAPVLTATLNFVVPGTLHGTGHAPDIPINEFNITVTVDFVTGVVTPTANVKAEVQVDTHIPGVGTINVDDVSGDVESKVVAAINGALAGNQPPITAAKVKSTIDSFFVSLLRLSGLVQRASGPGGILGSITAPTYADGHIQQYAIQGNSLVVTYYQVPRKPVAAAS